MGISTTNSVLEGGSYLHCGISIREVDAESGFEDLFDLNLHLYEKLNRTTAPNFS